MTDNVFNFEAEFQAAMDEWIAAASPIILEAARRNAPSDTGEFAQSLYPVFTKSRGSVEIEIRSDSTQPEMDWIIDGTRAHTIEAVSAKALAWQDKAGGDVVFAKSVMHPGTKPNDFADKTIEEVTPVLVDLLDAMIKKHT